MASHCIDDRRAFTNVIQSNTDVNTGSIVLISYATNKLDRVDQDLSQGCVGFNLLEKKIKKPDTFIRLFVLFNPIFKTIESR